MFTTKQINALKKKRINNICQFRRFAPLRYIDNTKETGLGENLAGLHAVIIGKLLSVDMRPMKSRKGNYILCKVQDRQTKKTFSVMDFMGSEWIYRKYVGMVNRDIIVSGTLSYSSTYGFSLLSPDVLSTDISGNMKVIPVNHKVKGISEKGLNDMIDEAMDYIEPETINGNILAKYRVVDKNTAIKMLFMPKTMADIQYGNKRMIFDDLYYLAGQFELSRRQSPIHGARVQKTSETDSIIKNLPFSLTNGQMEAYESIRDKMKTGAYMKALVQGDVGCGKTIVAFLSMLLAAENGYQAVLMAPTKILAMQHYEKLKVLVKDNDKFNAVLIASGAKKKEEKEVLDLVKSGTANLIIGTHSVLSDKVEFNNLGLSVIDEEHKFGVAQREKISEKSAGVDTISMSATPIPRTLALSLYGDDTLVISIKERPAGRQPVKTVYSNGNGIGNIVGEALKRGEQVYAVCPMIEESEGDTMQDVISTHVAADTYRKLFSNAAVEELNGENTAEETEEILERFQKNETQILVSTTVVEVGVDVPNATIMVIHNAERFGLAGMHQLRGRVGRGNKPGYCILVSKQTPEMNERLQTLMTTSDGFEIAEKDMTTLRHAGNLFGEDQSGKNRYLQEMLCYEQVYKSLKDDVQRVSDKEIMEHVYAMQNAERGSETTESWA